MTDCHKVLIMERRGDLIVQENVFTCELVDSFSRRIDNHANSWSLNCKAVSAFVQVQGKRNIMSLLSRLRPRVFVPLINASFPSEGPLSKVIKEDGSLDQLEKDLKAAGLDVIIREPAAAGKSMEVQL